MAASQSSGSRHRRAWVVFGFFVALPSVALALAGLRAISADEIERSEASRRRLELTARVADDALQAAFAHARTLDPTASPATGGTLFRYEPGGTLSFPLDRVFVADVGVLPARLSTAHGDDAPGGIPADIVTAITSRSPLKQQSALKQLRTGTWWLHLDQRRAYDAELVRRLASAGVKDVDPIDQRLELLAQARTILSAASSGMPGRATSVETPAGPAVIVWSRSENGAGTSEGLVFGAGETATLVNTALKDVMASERMAVRIRDVRGAVVWTFDDERLRSDVTGRPVSAVDGWTLLISPAGPSETRRSFWVYGLVVLPIALLAFGLVMTSRVVRRDVALAQRQAEFTAAVTHEFKTPIASLRLLMERISSGRVADGRALSEYHEAIARETDRLESLVNRLLDTQQIQAGMRAHSPVATDVEPLIAAAVERFGSQAAAKQIELQTHVAPGLIRLVLDPHAVADALDNLIDNALKYSPPQTAINITAEAVSGHLVIAVRDQGAGIHRDDLPHVFEPYYRGRLGDRESVRGTGLGLALVTAAARAHGGSVDVTSSPGQGSTFTLRLPLEEPA